MKKKAKTLDRAASAGLAVPEYILAGTAVLLGGTEAIIRVAADGVGFCADKCYDGEQAIADYRAKLDGNEDLRALQALNEQT